VANLVDNATRMTPSAGRVEVRLAAEEGWAVVTVVDQGPGIPPDDLPRLFDRFYRSEQSRARATGGAGLGLAIVRAIVTAHGGSIEARSPESGGAEFTVRLPAIRETPRVG
jgi:signal transduction histidine kinase